MKYVRRLNLAALALPVAILAWIVFGGTLAPRGVNANHDAPYPSPPTPCEPDAVTLISTGLAGIGGLDPLWTTVHEGVAGQPAVASGPAWGVTRPSSWVMPGGTNNWIDTNTTGDNFSDPGGLYVYETSFTVSSGMESLTLDFSFAVDNDVKLYLEDPSGTDAPIPLPGTYNPASNNPNHFNMLHSVYYPVATPAAGTYRLVAEVTNQPGPYPGIGNPVGLLLQGTITCELAPPCFPVSLADMEAWWPLDEGLGDTVVVDIKGGHDGTPMPGGAIGSPTGPNPVAGAYVGNSLDMGVSRYVAVLDDPNLNFPTGNFSIDAWVKVSQAQQIEPIVDKLALSTGGYFLFIQMNSLWLELGATPLSLQGPTITPGQWNYVAVTVTPSLVTMSVGVPPAALTTISHAVSPINATSTGTPLNIGHGYPNPHADIDIDEVEIFSRALAQPEIQGIFDAGTDGKCRPPVGGTTELLVDGADPPALAAGGSGGSVPYAAVAGGMAAGVLALAAGGWYARRRWMR